MITVSDCDRCLTGLSITDDQLTLSRPIGTMESVALIPVCNGVSTDFLEITPDATRSIWRYLSVSIGPLPSIGCPNALTTRPTLRPRLEAQPLVQLSLQYHPR